MATIEELQAQIAALSARVDALTVPPNRYYSSRYTGETIDKLLTSISGGAANLDLSNLTDYQRALHNIGGRPNRNLLINHYMIGTGDPGSFPINQKGQKIYTPDWNQYAFDMWSVEANQELKVEIKDGFVTLTNTSSDKLLQFKQLIPANMLLDGETYTLSIYAKAVSGSVKFQIGMTDPPYTGVCITDPKANDIVSATVGALPQVTSGGWKAMCYLYPEASITMADQKLEHGPIQTLGCKDDDGNIHLFETPDYGETLARCQRYGLFSGTSDLNAVPLSIGQAFLPTPVTMRAKPVIVGTPVVYNADTNSEVAGALVSVINVKQNGVVLQISGASAPERGYVLFPASTGLSAEL